MKIAVDASCWTNRRGFGRFTRELLRAALEKDKRNDYFFLIDQNSAPHCDFPVNASPVLVPTRVAPAAAAAADGSRSVPDILRMTWAARASFDLIFFPAVYSYFPVLPGPKCIVTFHDAIAERHPGLIFPSRRARWFWKMKTTLARRQADMIITVSENARQALIVQWKLPAGRIRVINEGPSPVFRRVEDPRALQAVLSGFGLDATCRFFIYVGGISPHKNLEFLVRCFLRVLQQPGMQDLKLLLVGDYEQDVFFSSFPALNELVRNAASQAVFFTGYLPDEQLLHLYNGALALVFPSLEEGFGLPAVEAMACGLPVLASSTGSLPELVGDAGLFFDPRNENELQAQLLKIIGDLQLREDLSASGLKRAAGFRWDRAAETLLEIFDNVGDGS